jgi:MFS family permease
MRRASNNNQPLIRSRRRRGEGDRVQGVGVSEAARLAIARPRVALWILVFAGPALRTSLLGCALVAEEAIGETFGLSATALAILVESIIFGGLVAVFVVPPLVTKAGIHRVSQSVAIATAVCLAAALVAAPFMSGGMRATAGLFIISTLLGFFAAVLSPITQTLLNDAASADSPFRRSLQSVWSAGQPTGFIVASVVGGLLAERFGWWAALAIPLAFAIASSLALSGRYVAQLPARDQTEVKPNLVEVAWIILALVAFELWSTWGSLSSWIEPGVLASLIATIIISMVAIGRMRRSPQPALSLAPFSIAGFAAATLILFIYQFPTTAEFEVLLLDNLGHMSAEEIGSRTAIGNLGQIAGTALAAVLLLRHQAGLALVTGFALTIFGLTGYALYPWWDGFAFAALTRTVTGFGSGLLTPVLFVLALNRMPASLQLPAGTWLVLAVIGGTEAGLALFEIVLEAATNVAGSQFGGYAAVEIAQLALGAATAIMTACLVLNRRLPLLGGPVEA